MRGHARTYAAAMSALRHRTSGAAVRATVAGHMDQGTRREEATRGGQNACLHYLFCFCCLA